MINLSLAETEPNLLSPRIAVMGVGGAGGNAVNNMIRSALEGCDFIVANTDSQALQQSLAPRKMQLGVSKTRGLGAGSKPEVGRAAAEEQLEDILACLSGADMVFVTAGMGGGTGTGAAPVIARAARDAGILTVGVVTKPFHFEGNRRMALAEQGIAELQQYVDTLIVIPNQNLFRLANERTTFAEAFRMADEVLNCGVRGITDLMVMPGFMNLDFADVKTVMAEMGKAMMGTGEADGDNRAIRAAEAAISNLLLDDVSLEGAKGVLINITGGLDMTLFEVDQAANRIREEVDNEAQIKVGSTLSDDLNGKIRVSVIATGIDAASMAASQAQTKARGESAAGRPPVIRTQQRASTPAAPPTEAPRTVSISMTQVSKPLDLTKGNIASPAGKTAAETAKTAPAKARAAKTETKTEAKTTINQMDMLSGSVAGSTSPEPAVMSFDGMMEGKEKPAPTATEATPAEMSIYDAEPVELVAAEVIDAPVMVKTAAPTASKTTATDTGSIKVTQIQTAAAREQKPAERAQSLFRRITGFGMVRPSSARAELAEESLPPAVAAGKMGTKPSERPQLSQDDDDVLDIPAFLRRSSH